MPTVNLTTKYLEDAQGNKYAPVTTPNAVRWPNGDDLDDKLAAKQAVIDSSNKLSASNVSGLATVATSGSYNDLSSKPTIPTYSVMGASGSGHASGLVPDTPSTAGTTKFLREDGTWQVPAGDVSGKEDKMSIVQITELISTLSPAINTLYMVAASTLDVTLPTITDTTKVQSFVIMSFFSSSNPSITIHGTQDNICAVYMPTDISLEHHKMYEINCMFLAQTIKQEEDFIFNHWSVAIRDIGIGNIE